MMLILLHTMLIGTGGAFLLAAGVHDLAVRTIPHWAVGGIVASALLLRMSEGALAPSLISATCTFAGACMLWGPGWLGGGDAKLLGAVAFLLPPASVLQTLYGIAVVGAALALPYVLLRGRLCRPAAGQPSLGLLVRCWRAERHRLRRGGPLPYGLAIAVGGLLNLWSIGR